MQISVVIPAYRAGKTISRAIDSVFAQTHPAHEIIVVDDGSPDDQADVIQRTYAERVLLVRQANGKTARARNTGLDRSTGDVIAFLDADDYWEPGKLEQQVAVFRQFPEVGIVAGRYFSQTPGEPRTVQPLPRLRPCDFERVLNVRKTSIVRIASAIWTGTVAIRRQMLGEERFVSGLEPAEDRDLWIRMLRHPAYLLRTPLATVVLEPGSISRVNLDADCENMLRVIERHRDLIGPLGVRLWKSQVFLRWSAPDAPTALPRLWRSFLLWPCRYIGRQKGQRLARLKRLLVLLRIKFRAGTGR